MIFKNQLSGLPGSRATESCIYSQETQREMSSVLINLYKLLLTICDNLTNSSLFFKIFLLLRKRDFMSRLLTNTSVEYKCVNKFTNNNNVIASLIKCRGIKTYRDYPRSNIARERIKPTIRKYDTSPTVQQLLLDSRIPLA